MKDLMTPVLRYEPVFGIFALVLITSLAIPCLAKAGDLDRSFGSNGVVTSGEYSTCATVIQSDGRIVTGGASFLENSAFEFGLARYNTDGSPDLTFGNSGRVITRIGDLGYSFATALAIQADGKIIAGGSNDFYGDGNYNFLLARYNVDGSLDPSFGSDGKVETHFDNEATLGGIAIQADGKIIAVGSSGGIYTTSDFLLARYEADGSLDPSFGSSGIVANAFGASSHATAVAVRSDGKITVAGSDDYYGPGNFLLARYGTDGSLDPTFGSGGRVVTPFEGQAALSDIGVQTDGKIVAVGIGGIGLAQPLYFALARYGPDGSLDPIFGSSGKVITTFSGGGAAYAVGIQTDGKIVAAGNARSDKASGLAAVRYDGNGSLDLTFGSDGKVITQIGDNGYFYEDIAIQSNGKIIVSGSFSPGHGSTLVRYQAQGNITFDYDGDGKSDISVFRPSDGAWYVQRSRDGLHAVAFGFGSDRIEPADYDGDGKTDIAVYRQSTGAWYVLNSLDGTVSYFAFGLAEDLPTPADYDGDSKADLSVFRPSTATWYRRNSSDGSFYAIQFGLSGDKPTIGDFDGDGNADVAIFRPSDGAWYQIYSSDNSLHGREFGFATDVIVHADYDGDGRTDIAVFRPSDGIWYIAESSDGSVSYNVFGLSDDIPAPGDFDGDGKTDISEFRPSDGTWYRRNSSDGSFFALQFGTSGDKPTQTAFRY